MTFKNNTVIAVVGLSAIFGAMSPVVAQSPGLSSPNLPDAAINRPSQPIKGQYIVVFKDSVQDVEREVANLNLGQTMRVLHVYKDAIKGFAAQIPDVAVNGLRRNPNVDYIEQDMTVSVNAVQSPVGANNGAWGLSRIDQPALPLDDSYIYRSTGSRVNAYIVDTGILGSHVDFGGRVGSGFTAFNDSFGTTDCQGHGTHVAGTVGGNTWGVAKRVNLIPVRVLDCTGSGSWSGVVAGIDWIVAHHQAGVPAVANMSLGGGASSTVDNAVNRGIADGVVFVVAAGNSNADACLSSPARTPNAITVGATMNTDARASYSNFGTCVDVFAPGSSIRSTWYTSTTATATLSGTSMASPHVAGVAALILDANTTMTTGQVATRITSTAMPNLVTTAGTGSPNLLLRAPASPNSPPPVTTGAPTVTSSTTATLNGALQVATSAGADYGFCFVRSSSIDPRLNVTGVTCVRSGSTSGAVATATPYSMNVSGLISLSNYRVRAYARTADGVVYGTITSFTTP